MAQTRPPKSRDGFEIAIICALPLEADAVQDVFDEFWEEEDRGLFQKVRGDTNSYTTGLVGRHNVVLAHMPNLGKIAASTVATNFQKSFPGIKLALVVGICGGVPQIGPQRERELILGDVVISTQVIQYDFGKRYPNAFQAKSDVEDCLGRANPEIRGLLKKLEGRRQKELLKKEMLKIMTTPGNNQNPVEYPTTVRDTLFPPSYRHKHQSTSACETCAACTNPDHEVCPQALKSPCIKLGCDETIAMPRKRFDNTPQPKPDICFGRFASGDTVMKSGETRDRIGEEQTVVAFEMEGSGVWDIFPSIIIKGVCDYADSHKNDEWHRYAAANAAACMKAFLREWSTAQEVLPSDASVQIPQQINPIATGNRHFHLPRAVSSYFTGYEDIRRKLKERLDPCSPSGAAHRVAVLTGLGGVGKSEVCLKFAHDNMNSFWGLFWVDVSSFATAEQGFKIVAEACGSTDTSVSSAKQALTHSKETWLLILDNADDTQVDYAKYIPAGKGGNIIITSRVLECGKHSTVGHDILEMLKYEDAVALLSRSSGLIDPLDDQTLKSVRRVVDVLGSHTIALVHAAAYIKKRLCTMEEYPRVFEKRRKKMLEFHPGQGRSHYGGVYATFEVSAAFLTDSGAEGANALELLHFLAFVHFDRVPEEIFRRSWYLSRKISDEWAVKRLDLLSDWHKSQKHSLACGDEEEEFDPAPFRESRSQLEQLSLISVNSLNQDMSLHPLVSAWAMDRIVETEQQQKYWLTTACTLAMSNYGFSGVEYPYLRSIQAHVESCMGFADRFLANEPREELFRLLLRLARFANITHRYPVAVSILVRLKDYQTFETNAKLNAEVEIVKVRQRLMRYLGNYKEMIELLQPIVDHMAQAFSDEDEDLLWFQHELADALGRDGQFQKASEITEHVVEVGKRTLEPDDSDLLASQHQLALTYTAMEKPEEAIALLKEVIKFSQRFLPVDHLSILDSQFALAQAYLKAGGNERLNEAISLLENLVDIKQRTLAINHPGLLVSQYELAHAYLKSGGTGIVDAAILLLENVVDIRQRTLAVDHPRLLNSQHELAHAYLYSGGAERADAAILLLEKEVVIRQRTLAVDHPHLLNSQHELAHAYLYSGGAERADAAILLLEKVVVTDRRILAENGSKPLSSLKLLADAYEQGGRNQEAVSVRKEVLQLHQATLEVDDPELLASMHRLAKAYLAAGETQQVIKGITLLESVVKVDQQTPAIEGSERLKSLKALADAYEQAKRNQDAISVRKEVLQLHEATLEADDPELLASMHRLAKAYLAAGETQQVIKGITLLELVVKVDQQTPAIEDSERLVSLKALANAYKQGDRKGDVVSVLEEVLQLHQATLEADDPELLASIHNLAEAYLAAGEIQRVIKGITLLESVVKTDRQTPAIEDSERLVSLKALADAYKQGDRKGDVVSVLEEVLQLHQATLEADDPELLASMHNLAKAYLAAGEPPQVIIGITLLESVVKVDQQTPAIEGSEQLVSLEALADAYKQGGRNQDAALLYEEAIELRLSLDAEDPKVLELRNALEDSRLADERRWVLYRETNPQVAELQNTLEGCRLSD